MHSPPNPPPSFSMQGGGSSSPPLYCPSCVITCTQRQLLSYSSTEQELRVKRQGRRQAFHLSLFHDLVTLKIKDHRFTWVGLQSKDPDPDPVFYRIRVTPKRLYSTANPDPNPQTIISVFGNSQLWVFSYFSSRKKFIKA